MNKYLLGWLNLGQVSAECILKIKPLNFHWTTATGLTDIFVILWNYDLIYTHQIRIIIYLPLIL